MKQSNFKAEQVSQSASFIVDAKIEQSFPLFGAFEERKWEPNFQPVLIYPSDETIAEGTTFKTIGHGDEPEYLWIVSKYNKQDYLIQYLISTKNRYWTITIQCKSLNQNKTRVTVNYTFLGLNKKGNKLNNAHIQRMYEHNLQDWAKSINTYLSTIS